MWAELLRSVPISARMIVQCTGMRLPVQVAKRLWRQPPPLTVECGDSWNICQWSYSKYIIWRVEMILDQFQSIPVRRLHSREGLEWSQWDSLLVYLIVQECSSASYERHQDNEYFIQKISGDIGVPWRQALTNTHLVPLYAVISKKSRMGLHVYPHILGNILTWLEVGYISLLNVMFTNMRWYHCNTDIKECSI